MFLFLVRFLNVSQIALIHAEDKIEILKVPRGIELAGQSGETVTALLPMFPGAGVGLLSDMITGSAGAFREQTILQTFFYDHGIKDRFRRRGATNVSETDEQDFFAGHIFHYREAVVLSPEMGRKLIRFRESADKFGRMNIKGLIGNIGPTDIKPVEKSTRTIKSDEAHDRDANGQQAFGDQQQHEPMSDEQLEKAMEHLRQLPATKEHKWQISLEKTEKGNFVLVIDNIGTLIRRIPEVELWTLPSDQSPRGQLLKKSA